MKASTNIIKVRTNLRAGFNPQPDPPKVASTTTFELQASTQIVYTR